MSDYLNIVVSLKGRELSRYSFSKAEVIIGRGADADVLIENAGVSRAHARIRCDASGVTVTDLQSNNGTFVNGAGIQTSPLKPGDDLRIGKFSIEVDYSHAPLASETPAEASPDVSTNPASGEPLSQAAAEPLDPDHTVIVSPKEKAQVLKEKPPAPVAQAPEARESRPLVTFLMGVVVGIALAWYFL